MLIHWYSCWHVSTILNWHYIDIDFANDKDLTIVFSNRFLSKGQMLFIKGNMRFIGADAPGRQNLNSVRLVRFGIEMFWSLKRLNSSEPSSQFNYSVFEGQTLVNTVSWEILSVLSWLPEQYGTICWYGGQLC